MRGIVLIDDIGQGLIMKKAGDREFAVEGLRRLQILRSLSARGTAFNCFRCVITISYKHLLYTTSYSNS
jgi:hypothetical protein